MSDFQYAHVSANVVHGFFEDSFPEPLDLICGQCGKRATFHVGAIAIDARGLSPLEMLKRHKGLEKRLSFVAYLRCANCHSALNWKYPSETLELIADAIAEGVVTGKRPQGIFTAALSLFDATPMHNLADGEDKLLAKIKEEPENGFLYNRLANIYEKSGMMEKAIECFNEAVRRNPQDFASWLQLAHANLDRGEFSEALEQYKKVLTSCWDGTVLGNDERYRIIEEALESILEISEKTGKCPQLPLPSRLREQGGSPPKIVCDLANEWGMDFAFALYADGEVDPDQCRVEETESGTIIRVRIPKDRAIPKNRPCPCGSGKVYKKCCGAE